MAHISKGYGMNSANMALSAPTPGGAVVPAEIRIIYRPLAALVPYARNARTHSPEQIGTLRASLARFGWTNPMLIAGDQMIAGHARLEAALAMAAAGEAIPGNPDPYAGPTVDLSHLAEIDRRAYVLADNQLALRAGWDADMLRLELTELHIAGFDLALTGFEPLELSLALGDPAADPNAAEGGSSSGVGSLAAAFGVPPFTVLNAREGWWQDRKRAWIALGIQSELGRGENLQGMSDGTDAYMYDKPEYVGRMGATPPHPPTVTKNPDGTLNYGGTRGQAKRFDAQRQTAAPDTAAQKRALRRVTPGGDHMPAADYGKTHARGDGAGKPIPNSSAPGGVLGTDTKTLGAIASNQGTILGRTGTYATRRTRREKA